MTMSYSSVSTPDSSTCTKALFEGNFDTGYLSPAAKRPAGEMRSSDGKQDAEVMSERF